MRTKQNPPVERYGYVKLGYSTYRLPLDKAHALQAALADAVEVRDVHIGGGGKYLRRIGEVCVWLADTNVTVFDATMVSVYEADKWEREITDSLRENPSTKYADCVSPEQWMKLKGE